MSVNESSLHVDLCPSWLTRSEGCQQLDDVLYPSDDLGNDDNTVHVVLFIIIIIIFIYSSLFTVTVARKHNNSTEK